ncbi:DUF262 domain-containing protein [Nonomuraea phyllanthi]|uniref:DUF262 domain-containing protein n=1 Tax=Nonomuraea phyllanthi TaxID=2219224 RepID=A0A5C4VVP9_9ACTN|nr:DUF262 domain-containing protein [Nonomuraea phyllanthi]KAB8190210.1 DUF262 domain-containing protein [Nonomuraea phyllanthi]
MNNVSANSETTLIDAVDDKVSSVKTRQLDISFNELADMYASGELIIQPEYQRLFRWTPGAQSRFIETLILELPVPPIFLMETEENVYELIDGLQRISSYLNFRGLLEKDDDETQPRRADDELGPLKLQDCDIVTDLNGHTYDSLPTALSRRLKRNFIRAEILRKESDRRLRYYMFKRLNSGGESLEPQEIRNCTIRLLDPAFNDEIIRLSKTPSFKYCTGTVADAQKEKRYDQELILRFFAFSKWSERYRHEVGDFLTEYMEAASGINGSEGVPFDFDQDVAAFEKTFSVLEAAAKSCEAELGSRIFGSVDTSGRIRGQFAVYHFEGITLGLQPILDRFNRDDPAQMERLGRKILNIKKSPEIRNFTGGGKNTYPAFKQRVSYFTQALSGIE